MGLVLLTILFLDYFFSLSFKGYILTSHWTMVILFKRKLETEMTRIYSQKWAYLFFCPVHYKEDWGKLVGSETELALIAFSALQTVISLLLVVPKGFSLSLNFSSLNMPTPKKCVALHALIPPQRVFGCFLFSWHIFCWVFLLSLVQSLSSAILSP